jgi:drug/metabolite transporter (DMT)-like permease
MSLKKINKIGTYVANKKEIGFGDPAQEIKFITTLLNMMSVLFVVVSLTVFLSTVTHDSKSYFWLILVGLGLIGTGITDYIYKKK